MNKEQWRDVPFDTAYEVSDQGRVASKQRSVRCGPGEGRRIIPGKILKPFLAKSTGYYQVNLTGHDRHHVHSLVARAFLPKSDPSLVVNHKSGDKTDNRLSNLEWVTHSENHRHSYEKLGRQGSVKGRFSGDHPTSKAVVRVCLKTGHKKVYAAASDAIREGFDSGSISRCCYGKNSSHKGYSWAFQERCNP